MVRLDVLPLGGDLEVLDEGLGAVGLEYAVGARLVLVPDRRYFPPGPLILSEDLQLDCEELVRYLRDPGPVPWRRRR